MTLIVVLGRAGAVGARPTLRKELHSGEGRNLTEHYPKMLISLYLHENQINQENQGSDNSPQPHFRVKEAIEYVGEDIDANENSSDQ